MSCNNVQILNFNHSIVEVGSDNKIIITDQVKCNSITIPQPVTNILQINSPGPQGSQGPQGPAGEIPSTASFATTGSNIFVGNQTVTGSLISTAGFIGFLYGTASWATNAVTASYALTNAGIVVGAVSASYASSSTYALTASYVPNILDTALAYAIALG